MAVEITVAIQVGDTEGETWVRATRTETVMAASADGSASDYVALTRAALSRLNADAYETAYEQLAQLGDLVAQADD